ncbi:MAG: hypothetical protein IJ215_05145 [Clostridia bacterium]|nr:hypothetical protein [Clostridia bacterium]
MNKPNFKKILGNVSMYDLKARLKDCMLEMKNIALLETDPMRKQREIGAINLINRMMLLRYFHSGSDEFMNYRVYDLVEVLKEDYADAKRELEEAEKALNILYVRMETLRAAVESYEKKERTMDEGGYEEDFEAREVRETLEENRQELQELEREFFKASVDQDGAKAYAKTLRALQGYLQNKDYFKTILYGSVQD